MTPLPRRPRRSAPATAPAAPGLRQEHDELSALSRHLMQVQEDERRTVAHELHDEIGQCLSAIRLQLAQLRRKSSDAAVLGLVASAERMADEGLQRVRRVAVLLHPPQLDSLGPRAAIRWHLKTVAEVETVVVSDDLDPRVDDCPPDLAIGIFRVVEQAVRAALQLGGARRIDVRLRVENGQLLVRVTHDGADPMDGVTTPPELRGLRERVGALGGDLRLLSLGPAASLIAASVPLHAGDGE